LDLRDIIKPHHITEALNKARSGETSCNEQKKFNTFGIFSVKYCTTSRHCERAPLFPQSFPPFPTPKEGGDKCLRIARLLCKLSRAQLSVISLIVARRVGLKTCPGHCFPYLYSYSHTSYALSNWQEAKDRAKEFFGRFVSEKLCCERERCESRLLVCSHSTLLLLTTPFPLELVGKK
jgi:hypothetical protein